MLRRLQDWGGISMLRALPVSVLVIGASVAVPAQGPAPTFDVASVRVTTEGGAPSLQVLDTRATLLRHSIDQVLRLAFRVKPYQLVAPGWLSEVRVDIQATLPAGATRQQVPEMLQALLAERFGLVVHRESRPTDAYELLIDAGGVKQMEEVEPVNELELTLPTSLGRDRLAETPDGPRRTVESGSGDLGDNTMTTVTARSRYSLTISKERTQVLNATRMAMVDFVVVLERVIGEPVLDKTNLVALYRFTIDLPLNYTLRQSLMRGAALFGRNPSDSPYAASPLPMVSGGLKGLGLRLEKRRSEIETIVVDKIERTPTEN
jgi:uncharacterized protein (TIGR03435 family)